MVLDNVRSSAPRVEATCLSCLKLLHLHGEIWAHLSSLRSRVVAQIMYPPWLFQSSAFANDASDHAQISSSLGFIGLTWISTAAWSRAMETTRFSSNKSLTFDFTTLCCNKEQLAARSGLDPVTNQFNSPKTARIWPFSWSVVSISLSFLRSLETCTQSSWHAYSFCCITMLMSPFWTKCLPKNSPDPSFTCLKGYFAFKGSKTSTINCWFPPKIKSSTWKAIIPIRLPTSSRL